MGVTSFPLVWITKTTRDGDTNARIGIAEHIGNSFQEVDVPTEFCTPVQTLGRLSSSGLINVENPRWPDVFIGPCFHIPYMQVVKALSGGKTIVVAMRPPVRGLPIKATVQDIQNTNLIVSYPHHDNASLPHIFLCESVPNRVSAKLLDEAKLRWQGDLSYFADRGQVIGLLLGGDVGDGRRIFLPEIATTLGREANRLAERIGGSILASTSARTSSACMEALCAEISVPSYIYDRKRMSGNNPFFGILAYADFLIVTADSISMCCEAASSGVPVYIFYDERIVESSHAEIVKHLVSSGCARILHSASTLEKYTYMPKNYAADVAERVQDMMTVARCSAGSYGSVV
ncbi:MAG: mitochondrial fission ELM1 family protein [Betaproteobacteria bacterium]|nr:mitochondrial fission ELM1 family protein [Betaproteobacteria bacterium]